MTRKEQIEEMVSRYADKPELQPYLKMAIEWADAHPSQYNFITVMKIKDEQLAIAVEALEILTYEHETSLHRAEMFRIAIAKEALAKIQTGAVPGKEEKE